MSYTHWFPDTIYNEKRIIQRYSTLLTVLDYKRDKRYPQNGKKARVQRNLGGMKKKRMRERNPGFQQAIATARVLKNSEPNIGPTQGY